ncbi:hypothetical protein [Fischerella sp. PCC 9605]|uniref:hypothetical protein n=1 Tax=Fischerella sp. PCC 9605 TaxID=1173024 RepID=UPI00047A8CA3|nr:hypothetical protein [Fischerella sp. PCC 9605]
MTTIWVDAHLSPAIASWIAITFDIIVVWASCPHRMGVSPIPQENHEALEFLRAGEALVEISGD